MTILRPWGTGDLALLRSLLGDPAMMEHLGGPETDAKIRERQERYGKPGSGQYAILDGDGTAVGWVGYWVRGEEDYETGWSVIPRAQRRGLAKGGMQELLAIAARDGDHRFVHAYPSVDNGPSNAIARSLGFELLGARDFEYPKGSWMVCNDWRFDLERLRYE